MKPQRLLMLAILYLNGIPSEIGVPGLRRSENLPST